MRIFTFEFAWNNLLPRGYKDISIKCKVLIFTLAAPVILAVIMAYQIIVEKHGGDIWFESEKGVDSTFCLTLPLCFMSWGVFFAVDTNIYMVNLRLTRQVNYGLERNIWWPFRKKSLKNDIGDQNNEE